MKIIPVRPVDGKVSEIAPQAIAVMFRKCDCKDFPRKWSRREGGRLTARGSAEWCDGCIGSMGHVE